MGDIDDHQESGGTSFILCINCHLSQVEALLAFLTRDLGAWPSS